MKLKGVKIKAFRLFDDVDLSFVNQRFVDKGCANFVSVYAPNGFGKTSLFDAIEFGMTNNIRRLKVNNFGENLKYEKRLSDFSSFIHNKKMPDEDIHIRLDLEGYKDGVVDRMISKEDEQNLLTSEGENKFFSEAILSQDWFSEFLSVNNAETRFKLFMENFHESQDLLEYHSQLKAKLKSLALEKGAMKKELSNLKKKLQNDVDEHILERLDNMVADLSAQGIKLDWKQKIDEDNMVKLEMEAEQRISEENALKKQAEDTMNNFEIVEAGRDSMIAVSQMDEHLKTIEEVTKQIVDLRQKLDVIIRLKDLMALLEKLGDERKGYVNGAERLQKLVDKYPQHKQLITVIEAKTKEIIACENEMKALDRQIENVEKERAALEEALKMHSGLFAAVENKIASLETDYANYLTCLKLIGDKQKEKAALVAQIEKQKTVIGAKDMELARLRGIQQKVYGRKVDVEMEGYEEVSKRIVTLSLSIVKRIERIDELTNNIEHQTAYHNQVSQLVNRSREMVSELKTGICPLCGHDYKSVELLLKSIEENNAVEESISQAIAQREELKEANKQDQQAREDCYKAFEKTIIDAVNGVSQDLNTLVAERMKMDEAFREANDVISINQEKVENEFAGFKGLTKEQVEKQYNESKEKLMAEIREKDKAIEKKDKAIVSLNETRAEQERKQVAARQVITETQNRWDYMEYQQILGDDTADDISLSLWKLWIPKIQETIAQYDKQISDADAQSKKLKEEQHADLSNEAYLRDVLGKKNYEKETLTERYFKTLQFMKKDCNVSGIERDTSVVDVVRLFESAKKQYQQVLVVCEKKLLLLEEYKTMLGIAKRYNQQQVVKKSIKAVETDIANNEKNETAVSDEIERLQKYLKDYVKNFFQVEQIQRLYNTIDPHPEYKEVHFDCDFSYKAPRLNVYMQNKSERNDTIVPTLYFSTAQINILSFCIFMAKALFAKTDDGDDVGCVFIDDPIQALDDINILSMIDLLRNVAFSLDRQIVMTTHDQNFFELLQKKIPQTKFNSCFVKLTERGKFLMVDN